MYAKSIKRYNGMPLKKYPLCLRTLLKNWRPNIDENSPTTFEFMGNTFSFDCGSEHIDFFWCSSHRVDFIQTKTGFEAWTIKMNYPKWLYFNTLYFINGGFPIYDKDRQLPSYENFLFNGDTIFKPVMEFFSEKERKRELSEYVIPKKIKYFACGWEEKIMWTTREELIDNLTNICANPRRKDTFKVGNFTFTSEGRKNLYYKDIPSPKTFVLRIENAVYFMNRHFDERI